MNNKTDHIFNQLKEFEIKAPGELWDILSNKLFEDDIKNKIKQVKDVQINPPDNSFLFIEKEIREYELKRKVSKVKDAVIEPAEALYKQVSDTIEKESTGTKAKLITPVFKKVLLVAAASVGVVFAGLFLKFLFPGQEHFNTITKSKTEIHEKEYKHDSIKYIEKSITLTNSSKKETKQITSNKFTDVVPVFCNGEKMQISYNDLLFSFAGYNYSTGKRFFSATKNFQEITVSDYGNINISPYVYSVISDIYQVKNNGRMTRKAKKAKAKIAKWRRQDEHLFDKRIKYNPLDIIDLSETVYR